ncbi:MAG: LacI family DNA-binding transcriptional regulator, partial [Firmicutes bacterium]|nr:LacI family DNA-binding transcriptional regulator [Bacillota bacterium]
MKNKRHKLTIHELAADLALSAGTVSKILNDKGSVTEATRKRVLDRAKALGYVASHSARILKAEHTWT